MLVLALVVEETAGTEGDVGATGTEGVDVIVDMDDLGALGEHVGVGFRVGEGEVGVESLPFCFVGTVHLLVLPDREEGPK